ncbi:SixA phosphatase family protein [Pedobacter namyangjuensis]|uniref:SixA phosphatase family protein n=1 Tax=Pedobacter namyangjuensis TaxID=600626 RepID=UPI000DE55847|nr:histidine phosphatase family protein [Pedobacter namyangjuensis]
MKELIIIRHAKSDWGNSSLKDFDRPLNKRGMTNAPEMANRLVKQNIIPDLIVSSPALRAITTAKHFAQAWQIADKEIKLEPNIYEASRQTLFDIINDFDDRYSRIAVFGHNPGLTDLLNYLNGHVYEMPTCGVCYLQFPIDNWSMLSHGTGKALLFDYPKSDQL